MEQWIRDLISQSTARISALIEAITDRITWVYKTITLILLAIRLAWAVLVISARYYLTQGIAFASETYKTLYWITRIRIPQVTDSLARTLGKWALQQIDLARTYAKQLVDTAARWAKERLAELSALVGEFIQWVRGRIDSIASLLGAVSRLVGLLLTSPQRMAAWLIGALIAEFWRYIDNNADRIADALRRRAVFYTLRAADRIEDVLSRLI